jgi:hypothetical protein
VLVEPRHTLAADVPVGAVVAYLLQGDWGQFVENSARSEDSLDGTARTPDVGVPEQRLAAWRGSSACRAPRTYRPAHIKVLGLPGRVVFSAGHRLFHREVYPVSKVPFWVVPIRVTTEGRYFLIRYHP